MGMKIGFDMVIGSNGIGGGGASFSPASIPGLDLNLDARNGVYNTGTVPATDGQLVASWQDQSITQALFSQGTDAAKPTFRATGGPNGFPCVQFDGGDVLASSVNLTGGTRTVFVVYSKTAAGTGNKNILRANQVKLQDRFSGAGDVWGVSMPAATDVSSGQQLTNAFSILAVVIRAANDVDLYTNGVMVNATNGTSLPTTTGSTVVGSNAGNTESINGKISHLLTYNVPLTTTQVSQVLNFLSNSWGVGISLATTPLTKFTNITQAPNTSAVSAGTALYDGWVDELGGFSISSGLLQQTTAAASSPQRRYHLMRPTSEASLDQTAIVHFVQGSGFVIPWAKYNTATTKGYRCFVNTGVLTIDKITGTTNTDSIFGAGGLTLTAGQEYVLSIRAQQNTGGGTLLTATVYTVAGFNAVPQVSLQSVSGVITDTDVDGLNPVAVTASEVASAQNTIKNLWAIDNTKTQSGTTVTVPNPSNLAYIGSSTWFNANGAGPYAGLKVPAIIDSVLEATYAGASIATINGAVSGTTTADFLPGTANSNAVKASVQGASGYKVLRLMIGSNDASTGVSTATWMNNMSLIIQDALTWPVDLIIIEEIGVRLDGAATVLNRIADYNAKRGYLTGPKVKLGNAATFKNQSFTLSNLQGDFIHQDDTGATYLAQNQAAEIVVA